jgi:heme exporter protein A
MRLVAENLAVERDGRTILDDLSFNLEDGTALVVTGPNGSGKTTLIRAIAGFLPLSRGSLGLGPDDPDLTIGERCHYVGHQSAVRSSLTVAENVRFWASYLSGAAARSSQAPIEAALDAFALSSLRDVPAGYLSAGQKRRLALSRLLACRRPLWLLDEPATSLDAQTQAAFNRIVDAHLAGGGLAVIATHAPLDLTRQTSLQLAGTAAAHA